MCTFQTWVKLHRIVQNLTNDCNLTTMKLICPLFIGIIKIYPHSILMLLCFKGFPKILLRDSCNSRPPKNLNANIIIHIIYAYHYMYSILILLFKRIPKKLWETLTIQDSQIISKSLFSYENDSQKIQKNYKCLFISLYLLFSSISISCSCSSGWK